MYWIYEDSIYILLTGKCNDSALHGLDKFTKNACLKGCRILLPQLLQHLSNFNKSAFTRRLLNIQFTQISQKMHIAYSILLYVHDVTENVAYIWKMVFIGKALWCQ